MPLHRQPWASKLASVSYMDWSGSLSSGCSYTPRMRRAEPPQWGHSCCPWLLKATGLQATCPALLGTQVLHPPPRGHLCQAREQALGLLGPAGLRCTQRPLHRVGIDDASASSEKMLNWYICSLKSSSDLESFGSKRGQDVTSSHHPTGKGMCWYRAAHRGLTEPPKGTLL